MVLSCFLRWMGKLWHIWFDGVIETQGKKLMKNEGFCGHPRKHSWNPAAVTVLVRSLVPAGILILEDDADS